MGPSESLRRTLHPRTWVSGASAQSAALLGEIRIARTEVARGGTGSPRDLRFKGKFYNFDLMTPFFNPGPIAHPTVPVFVAGVNRYMCRMAGEVCDGLHVH